MLFELIGGPIFDLSTPTGMYLTDLTFIEDGNPDLLQDGYVNFLKRRRIATVIREIRQYQQTPYNFQTIPEILQFAKDVQGLDEAQAYSLALLAEPKEKQPDS